MLYCSLQYYVMQKYKKLLPSEKGKSLIETYVYVKANRNSRSYANLYPGRCVMHEYFGKSPDLWIYAFLLPSQ